MDRLGLSAGDSLSPEQLPEFSRILTEEVMPCLLHQLPMSKTNIK
jgi:hypothetical protein